MFPCLFFFFFYKTASDFSLSASMPEKQSEQGEEKIRQGEESE